MMWDFCFLGVGSTIGVWASGLRVGVYGVQFASASFLGWTLTSASCIVKASELRS